MTGKRQITAVVFGEGKWGFGIREKVTFMFSTFEGFNT